MSERIIIQTDGAPAPIGPYSQAIRTGDMLYISGQIGLIPGEKRFAGADTETQLRQIFTNVHSILDFVGITYHQVVRVVIYMADLKDMRMVNAVFGETFIYEPPARSTIQVAGLPGGARIEVEITAMIPPESIS